MCTISANVLYLNGSGPGTGCLPFFLGILYFGSTISQVPAAFSDTDSASVSISMCVRAGATPSLVVPTTSFSTSPLPTIGVLSGIAIHSCCGCSTTAEMDFPEDSDVESEVFGVGTRAVNTDWTFAFGWEPFLATDGV